MLVEFFWCPKYHSILLQMQILVDKNILKATWWKCFVYKAHAYDPELWGGGTIQIQCDAIRSEQFKNGHFS